MNELIKKIREARIVWVCGNGGSASTAEHFTCDLILKGIRAVCLNSNVSTITAIANDFGYQYIFSKQLNVLGDEDDLLITISCSGTSPDIVTVKHKAKEMGISTFSFVTFSDDKDYEKLEDEHLQFCHQIKKLL